MANESWDSGQLAEIRQKLNLTSSQAWLVVDGDGQILAANRTAEIVFGFMNGSLAGRAATNLFDDAESFERLLRKPRGRPKRLTVLTTGKQESWSRYAVDDLVVLVSQPPSQGLRALVPFSLSGIIGLAGLDEFLPEWVKANLPEGRGFLAVGVGGTDFCLVSYWPKQDSCPAPLRFSGDGLPAVRLGRAYPSLSSDLISSDPWKTGFTYLPLIYSGQFVGLLATSGDATEWMEARDDLAQFLFRDCFAK